MTQILRQSTQIKVVLGPVVAVGDGFTPVTSLSLAAADEAEILKHDAAAVTDISGATFAAITAADGYYNLTLTTSHTDTVGLMTVLVNDDSLCLPVKQTFQVVEEIVYDQAYATSAIGRYTRVGTAQAGAAGSITLDTGASTVDNYYSDQVVQIISGAGAGQARFISGYTGSTRVATVAPNWNTSNPDSTSVFGLIPIGQVNLGRWRGSLPNNLNSGRVESHAAAMAAGVITSSIIAANAIGASQIANDAITAAKIATDAITAAKIATDALGAAQIAAAGANKVRDTILSDATAFAGANIATLVARLTAARAGYLDNLNGHVAQTGDSFARLGAPAGASLSADVASIDGRLPAALVNGRMNADVEALGDNAAAVSNLRRGALAIVIGSVAAGSTTTVIKTNLTETEDNQYARRALVFTSGVLAGQATDITAYDGTTNVGDLTVTALTQAPGAGDLFVIT